jgi:hypothetical protein
MPGLAYVIPMGGLALEDVDVEGHRRNFGGADGIRTHDLLDAIGADDDDSK